MKYLKFFENMQEEEDNDGLITVPYNFDDKLKGLREMTKRNSEMYKIPINKIKIDLFYHIKWSIREWIDSNEKSHDEYYKRINIEIDGILYKFSNTYKNIDKKDVNKVKNILWEYIDKFLPYDEVKYHYTYKLEDKIFDMVNDFLNDIKEKGLWND